MIITLNKLKKCLKSMVSKERTLALIIPDIISFYRILKSVEINLQIKNEYFDMSYQLFLGYSKK